MAFDRAVVILLCALILGAGVLLQSGSNSTSQTKSSLGPMSSISSPPRGTPIIAAAGDICGETPETCSPSADLIKALHPNAVLTLGDNQYNEGTLTEYIGSYDRAWGAFKRITHPVAGNHEWETPDAQGYLDYFHRVTYWYSFRIGGWRLYALDGTCADDGGCGVGDPQYEWLRQKLAARTDRCILAYWHQPRFSSGTTHGSASDVGPLWHLLYAAGADLVLNGHEHNYERFKPQDPQGHFRRHGIVEIVAGTGGYGEGSYPFGVPITNSRVRLNGLGVVVLRLGAHGWGERFLRPSGHVADRAAGNC